MSSSCSSQGYSVPREMYCTNVHLAIRNEAEWNQHDLMCHDGCACVGGLTASSPATLDFEQTTLPACSGTSRSAHAFPLACCSTVPPIDAERLLRYKRAQVTIESSQLWSVSRHK